MELIGRHLMPDCAVYAADLSAFWRCFQDRHGLDYVLY